MSWDYSKYTDRELQEWHDARLLGIVQQTKETKEFCLAIMFLLFFISFMLVVITAKLYSY